MLTNIASGSSDETKVVVDSGITSIDHSKADCILCNLAVAVNYSYYCLLKIHCCCSFLQIIQNKKGKRNMQIVQISSTT